MLVDERMASQVRTLIQYPEAGRPGRVDTTRELVIQKSPYVVSYTVTGQTVRILRVLHGAQMWPDVLPE